MVINWVNLDITMNKFQAKRVIAHNLIKLEREMTLKQAYFLEYQKVQCAFKDSMIHENLQFILLIAFRCVLHRCENQEIRC